MAKQTSLHVPLGLAVVALAACASPYTPAADFTFEPIPEFTGAGELALVNGQPSTEEHNIGGSFLADYNAWTDVAIEIAGRELSARGLTIAPQGGKSLTLSITGARYLTGWVKLRAEVDLEVLTGDGYRASYTGANSSVLFAAPKRKLDGTMMRAVVELLRDPEIVSYLRR